MASLKWYGKQVKNDMDKNINKMLLELGILTQTQAVLYAPKDTTRLAGSLTVRRINKTVRSYLFGQNNRITDLPDRPTRKRQVIVGTNVDYAYHQEKGTKFTRPQPFIRPAFAQMIRASNKIIEKYVKKVTDKYDGK